MNHHQGAAVTRFTPLVANVCLRAGATTYVLRAPKPKRLIVARVKAHG